MFFTWTGYQPLHQVYILQQDQINLCGDNGQSGEYKEELFISLDIVNHLKQINRQKKL